MRTKKRSQKSFPRMCPIEAAVEDLATKGEDDRGAIFTRVEVVDFILDLVGYTPRKKLFTRCLLEPSFGRGDFLLPCVDRLLTSWRRLGSQDPNQLNDAIRAVELHKESFDSTRSAIIHRLHKAGIATKDSKAIVKSWLHHNDFLLWNSETHFNFVVGNPPYIRIERIPDVLMKEYRRRFHTMYDRADLYIPFIEHSLTLLAPNGHLGFICADRWMKNRYGGPLRSMIEKEYRLKYHVDMVDTPAFHSNVMAYPAVTVISREKPGAARVAEKPVISPQSLSKLARNLIGKRIATTDNDVRSVDGFASGSSPWLLSNCEALALVRKIESQFPLIENTGCKIGIGVATGADKVYIGAFNELAVEPNRKLPLATTRDVRSGFVRWSGSGVINPFENDGKLVDLAKYPMLRRYLEQRQDVLKKRHIAMKSPSRWYRTIDRIHPNLANQAKLLVPDIKGNANIVYEDGRLYPHHNLYFVTANDWNLKALQVVLSSGLAQLFVSLYSTRMRGEYLRFQAQHLRRICVPYWKDVCSKLKTKLLATDNHNDRPDLVAAVFGLTESELETLVNVPKKGCTNVN